MTFKDLTHTGKVVKKFEELSNNYHRLSLLFHELSQSIRVHCKNMNPKQFKDYLRELNLDIDKIIKISKTDLTLSNLKAEVKE